MLRSSTSISESAKTEFGEYCEIENLSGPPERFGIAKYFKLERLDAQ
jgi:hypothetical protein